MIKKAKNTKVKSKLQESRIAKELNAKTTIASGSLYFQTGVYAIFNLENDKVYVGSSRNVPKRKIDHFYKLRKGTHSNKNLQYDFDIFGEDTFEFMYLEEVEINLLPIREKYYMNRYNNLYNIYTNPNYMTDEGSNKLKSKCSGELNGNYGNKLSDETKKLMRDRRWGEGYVCKPKPKYQRKSKEELELVRQQSSERMKNRIITDEFRQKIAKARLGTKASAETRAKLSANNRGTNNPRAKLTEEQVLDIYHRMNSGEHYSTICEEYKIHFGQAYKIKRKKHGVFYNGEKRND